MIGKLDTVESFFVGQGDIIVFDKPADYSVAKLSTLANAKSLGNILLDSTTLNGDAPSLTQIKNEQNVPFYGSAVDGSFGFEFFVPNTSSEMVKALMQAEVITDTFTGANGFSTGAKVTGMMHKSTVSEKPIMIVNELKNQALVVPKGKLVASLAQQEKVIGVLVTVLAEHIDTANLKTVMLVDGAVDYDGSGE